MDALVPKNFFINVIPIAAAAIPPILLIAKYVNALLVCPCIIHDTISTLYVENVVYDPQNPTPNNNFDRGDNANIDVVDTVDVAIFDDGVIGCIVDAVEIVVVGVFDNIDDTLVHADGCITVEAGMVGDIDISELIVGAAKIAPSKKLPVILMKAVCQPR